MLGPLGVAGTVGVLAVALQVRDPHDRGSWGLCPLKALTGLDCPGCGGLRAVNDLGNLDLVAAASSNLLLVLAVPLLVGLWATWVLRAWRGEGQGRPLVRHQVLLGQSALVLTVLFAVARNLPFGAWLAA